MAHQFPKLRAAGSNPVGDAINTVQSPGTHAVASAGRAVAARELCTGMAEQPGASVAAL